MATKIFCDRCGKETAGNRTVEINLSVVHKKFDLCANCASDFEAFMTDYKSNIGAIRTKFSQAG